MKAGISQVLFVWIVMLLQFLTVRRLRSKATSQPNRAIATI